MVYAPRDNHQYFINSPQNHTLLLFTKHALGHITLLRDKLFLVALVSATRPLSFGWHLSIGDYKRPYQVPLPKGRGAIDKRHPKESGLVHETMVAEKGQPPAASKSRSGNQKPTSAIEKPKRQLKADVGNSKIEAAIENQERIYRNTCVAFQNLLCM